SHELRTPLNAIIGFSELLSGDSLGDYSIEKSREYATDIKDSGRHLLSIINDILDLSKVEAGKMNFYEDDVDIGLICETATRVLNNQALKKNITISLDVPNNLPLIRVDERMMQQILSNLISNAVKFSFEGGEVFVSVVLKSNDDMLIKVADDGIGIDKDKVEDVLKPFHQVETSYSKTEEGTGLGLSLVKAFVELHDGDIHIDSELGHKTTVIVRLPKERMIFEDHKIHAY
ncbi:MAG: HAMP domain-containing histidine kinase, partial [Kordiimonadaceae bacterium]|nr:HAMP domain-containing histidine kinase [Kordiimonadaceae bacterium]